MWHCWSWTPLHWWTLKRFVLVENKNIQNLKKIFACCVLVVFTSYYVSQLSFSVCGIDYVGHSWEEPLSIEFTAHFRVRLIFSSQLTLESEMDTKVPEIAVVGFHFVAFVFQSYSRCYYAIHIAPLGNCVLFLFCGRQSDKIDYKHIKVAKQQSFEWIFYCYNL